MAGNTFQRCHHIIPISVILFVLLIIKLEKVISRPRGSGKGGALGVASEKSGEISSEKVKPSARVPALGN